MQGFLGLRAYGDFDAVNRAPGWSTWLTFAISHGRTHRSEARQATVHEIGFISSRDVRVT
jgi:hypothetical protein